MANTNDYIIPERVNSIATDTAPRPSKCSGTRIDAHVRATGARPEADRDAATAMVRRLEDWADTADEDGRLWHGWALHRAFLEGVDYARKDGAR